MPRYIKQSTFQKRRERGNDKQQLSRTFKWVDPYPEVHGTLPEKMVYAELTRLGIPFLFLNDIHFTFPEIDFDKSYQADFVIPDAKIIIEVQGAYWHSKPEALESDAFKLAVYETAGYKALAWWDFDIIARLHDLVIAEPALAALARYTPLSNGKGLELPVVKRTKVDTSKGIRTLNQRRRRPNAAPQSLSRNQRKGVFSYESK